MPNEVFTEAPEEVTRYFDAKEVRPSFDWRDIAPHEHASSFTVAKSAGFDILDDVREAAQSASRDYKLFGDFADELEPILRKKGWWGRKKVVDPRTGKTVEVQLGSLRRLRTIYWANTRTARAAGEWERIQRTKRGLPFLVYELSVAERRRPEHESWVGIVLPVDDPFWQTHYPPNGWLCQCRVRQISRREAESLGYDPEAEGPQVVYRSWKNKRTGERYQVPEGIDPGWQTNPGATRAKNLRTFLTERLDTLPDAARRVAVQDMVGDARFKALARGEMPYAGSDSRGPVNRERGRLALPVAVLPARTGQLMDTRLRTVLFSNADAHKQIGSRRSKTGKLDVAPDDYAIIQDMLERGEMFESLSHARSYLFRIEREDGIWIAIVRRAASGRELFLKSFRRDKGFDYDASGKYLRLE